MTDANNRTRVRIVEIKRFAVDNDYLFGFGVDEPTAGQEFDTPTINVGGWVIGRLNTIQHIEVVWAETELVLRHCLVNIARPDVAQVFPNCSAAGLSGFYDRFSIQGLPPEIEVKLQVSHPDGHVSQLAAIRIQREFHIQQASSIRDELLQPLLITGTARSGTTWLMHLLAQHPAISVYPSYPYEAHIAGYFWHLYRVLTGPGSLYGASHPDHQWFDLERIGHPPILAEMEKSIGKWRQGDYLKATVSYVKAVIDTFYRSLTGLSLVKKDASELFYFAEKQVVPAYSWTFWEIYYGMREIFLVRDFRDVFCSILAFNQKRGTISFGRERCSSDEEYAEWLADQLKKLRDNWSSRREFALLVRYEELLQSPLLEIQRVLKYLNLDDHQDSARELLRRAEESQSAIESHRTSETVLSSVGRWRRELDPKLQRVVNNCFAEVLKDFGYDVD